MASSTPYVLARSADQVGAWSASAAGVGIVAVDTETTGWDPHRDRLALVQLSAGPDHPVLVVDAQAVDVALLGSLLADPAVLKVLHHGAFDLRFLAAAGLSVTRVADTMLAEQLLDGGSGSHGFGLADIASFRLGMQLDKSVRSTFDGGELSERQLRYAAEDAHATWQIFDQQWRELVGHGLTRVAQIEFAALPVLAGIQFRGLRLDAPRWERLLGEIEAELPAAEEAVQAALVTDASPRDLFGAVPVNLDSPEQAREALARLGVDVPSTREVVLRDHAEHPAVAAFLRYRQLRKVASNWGGGWMARVVNPVTGRVHADWRQIVGTGRIACSEPNLTQVPRDDRYRACFGGEPGRAYVVADYSQQELRILAAVSGDDALAEVFRRGGDLHRTTAAMVFAVPEEAVSLAQRRAAKSLNFGLLYGMGAPGFARATGTTLEQARTTMRRYFDAFPRVEAWLAEAEASAKRSGRARTPLGRIRVLGSDGATATLARNAPIQGAGADMTKLALAEVQRRLAERFPPPGPLDFGADGPVLVVHDEVVVEVSAQDAPEVAVIVRDAMLAAAAEVLGDVPGAVDVAVRSRWGADPLAEAPHAPWSGP